MSVRSMLAVAALVVAIGLAFPLAPRLRAQSEPAPAPRVEPRPAGETTLTPEQERALDVKTAIARRARGDHPLVTGGKVGLDLDSTVRVRPLVASTIHDVRKHPGEEVKKGDVIFVLESTDLGDAKNGWLTARASLDLASETYLREAKLREQRATTDADYFAARAAFRTARIAVESARQRCFLLGVRQEDLDELERAASPDVAPGDRAAEREVAAARRSDPGDDDGRARARTAIRAPIDGVLIAKDAARGELVDSTQVIATVSDLSTVWILADVYQRDIAKVRLGAKVDVTVPTYGDDAPFAGTVAFLSEAIDDATKTLKARIVVKNDRRLLKSGMAAKAVIHCVDEVDKLELKPDAIVREGERPYVIVKTGPGRYARRPVKLSLEARDTVHVDEGIAEGDEVVVDGMLFIHAKIPLGD